MKSFKPIIFIYPVGDESNKSIVRYPKFFQDDPNFNTLCYFGKNPVELPTYSMDQMAFEYLKASDVSFYAFIQNEKDGRRQYFHSQNLGRQKNNDRDALAAKIAKMLEAFESEKVKA